MLSSAETPHCISLLPPALVLLAPLLFFVVQ
jgi:hypothetical protein